MSENRLSGEQTIMCVDLLQRLEPGFLPLEIFAQVARLMRIAIVDVIPIKREGGELLIGLVPRSPDDLWWPSKWHLPGTVLRSDDTMDTAINRLLTSEINSTSSDKPIFHTFTLHDTLRGSEVVLVHSLENCKLSNESTLKWFPIDDLPPNIMESEKDVINDLKLALT